jgi:hypothetical protein
VSTNGGRDNGLTTSGSPWPRDLWLTAIWECEAVKPNERVVAYVYARYAGATDTSWCSWDELKRRTGIRSRDAISRAITGLVKGGWLKEVERARQHRSTVYELTTPAQQSVSRTADSQQSVSRTPQQSVSRTPEEASSPFPETSSPFPETSSPFRGPHLSKENSDEYSEETGAPHPAEAEASRSVPGLAVTDALFAATPVSGAKNTRKAKPAKFTDPDEQLRQQRANDLATQYHQALNGMTKFVAVRQIVAKALQNYPYEQVAAGLKHMATVERDRTLTLATLRSGIERASGTSQSAHGRVTGYQPYRNPENQDDYDED